MNMYKVDCFNVVDKEVGRFHAVDDINRGLKTRGLGVKDVISITTSAGGVVNVWFRVKQ